MDIIFRNRKLEREFNEDSQLKRKHGAKRARKIKLRLTELKSASSLRDLWPPKSGPGRCHELTGGKRTGQISVDLDHPYRLLFVPAHNPIPTLTDGGLDWAKVTAIKIIGVEDTHG